MFSKFIYNSKFLEILPGASSWLILILPILIAAFHPAWVAAFVIAFDFYWLVRAIIFGVYLISGYFRIKRDSKIDWMKRLQDLKLDANIHLEILQEELKHGNFLERKRLHQEIKRVKKAIKYGFLDWEKIYQVVILPTYKEPVETLESSIESYEKSEYPNSRIMVVVAMEEREGEEIYRKSKILMEKFQNKFKHFMVTYHPDIVGELKGKGANSTWAAKKLEQYLDSEKIPDDHIIVSIFDADTRVHPKYFSTLTYKYIINPNRRRRSFQPIPLYSNNIWKTTPLNRLTAFSSTFWQMIESTRPYRMINFSSQAMSFQTLKDIDFWDTKVVSEDSKQYYRAFFKYKGNHQAIPIFCPVYMDAVVGKNFWESLKNQYKQKRRWAWGVEHFPYFIRESRKHPEISSWEKFVQIFRMVEGHINWATASLLIAFTLWYPNLLHPEFALNVLGYNLPIFARYLLMSAWFGIIVSATISVLLLPEKPKKFGFFKYLEMLVQWVLIPISAVFFGSLPAMESQTRLMIGKPLGFWVTPKEKQ